MKYKPYKNYIPVTKAECKYFLPKYCYTINLPCNTGNCERYKREKTLGAVLDGTSRARS